MSGVLNEVEPEVIHFSVLVIKCYIGVGGTFTIGDFSGTAGTPEPFDRCPESTYRIILTDIINPEPLGIIVNMRDGDSLRVKFRLIFKFLGEGTRSTEE
jgi:hypothetical protein